MQIFMLIDIWRSLSFSVYISNGNFCFVKMGKNYYSLVFLEEYRYIKRKKDNIGVRDLNAEITSSIIIMILAKAILTIILGSFVSKVIKLNCINSFSYCFLLISQFIDN